MIRYLFLVILTSLTVLVYAQVEGGKEVKAYWDIAMSANIWPGANKTVGIQTTGGAIFNNQISVGLGLGVGSRNYEYITIPFELGIILWQGNGAVRIYGGPTFETYGSDSGFLGGTEVVFRPRFDMRNLKLFLAAGLAFDQSGPGYYNFGQPFDPSEKTFLAGPRIRIGLGL